MPGMPILSGGMNSAGPAPLPDERVLELAGIKLAELTGKQWRVEPGPLLKGPGTLGVRPGHRHSDSYRHYDLEFLLHVGQAAETSLPDCAVGLASDPAEAAREAVAAWADTTAAVALELRQLRGQDQRQSPPAVSGRARGDELAAYRADEHGESLPPARPPRRR